MLDLDMLECEYAYAILHKEWITSGGEHIPVACLSDEHLGNCMSLWTDDYDGMEQSNRAGFIVFLAAEYRKRC